MKPRPLKKALCPSKILSLCFLSVVLCVGSFRGLNAGQANPALSTLPVVPAKGVDAAYIKAGWDSPFGVDYIFPLVKYFRSPELVRVFGGVVRVRWADFSKLDWGALEPKPPRDGKHFYNWEGLDEAVRAWQHYGVHIMMTLGVHSNWGTATSSGKKAVYLTGMLNWIVKHTAYLPKPEHLQDYRDFISNLVERYDGDGNQDMPGLLFPILHYQIGNEYSNELFFGGTAEEYGTLLKESFRAAKKASPDVKIILSGVNFDRFYGFYDREMDPLTKAYVEKNLPKVTPVMKRFWEHTTAFDARIAQFCDFYDILDARWPYYGYIVEWRQLLQKFGCKGKEIWSAEMYSNLPLLPPDTVTPNGTLYPYPAPSKSGEYIHVLKRPGDPRFPKINAWFRGLQAAYVVKSCMPALDAGSKKLMLGYAVDDQNFLVPYPMMVDGLLSKRTGKLWPCAYAYKQLIEKLDGMKSCRRLSMPKDAYVYECTVKDNRKVRVAFYDDHIAQNEGEPLGVTQAKIPFEGKEAEVTHIITEIGKTEPATERIRAKEGYLGMQLTEYPVFIESVTSEKPEKE